MTDEFDRELRDRLARVSAAVPVHSGTMTRRPAAAVVRSGSASRRFAVGAFAPVVVVLAATVIAGLARVGPFAPAATGSTQVVSTVRDGSFELAISSAKANYARGEAIDVAASLTFRGPEDSISIAHGHGSPIAFGVVERVNGVFLTPAWRESCERSVLERDIPLARPFAKSGSFSGDNPAASDAAGFFADPTLVLPEGTWHLYVVADFGIGECGVDRHLLRADLEIVVATSLVTDPPAPVGTTAPAPTIDEPISSTDNDGPYTLEIRSERATYHESDAIEVVGAFSYSGDTAVDVSGFWPLLFSVDEPVYGIRLSTIHTAMCTNDVLAPGDRFEHPFVKGGAISGSDPDPAFTRAYLDDPVFRLPVGTWHIRLDASVTDGTCVPPTSAGHSLSVVLEIVVLPDVVGSEVGGIDLTTGRVPTLPNGTKGCLMALGGGILALNPRTGLGFTDESGKVIDVVWPDGYSARYQDGIAILIDDSGHLVATLGDEMSLGGGYDGGDNVFHVCGAGMVGDAEAPQSSLATDGGFELRLAASNPTFQDGAPIEVEWSLVNARNPGAPQVVAVSPLVAFSAQEVGGSRHVEANLTPGCAPFGLWTQGDPVRGYFEESGPLSDWSDPAFVHGFGQDRDVYLPVGTWVLSATTQMFDDACEVTSAYLQATITITILP